MKTSQINNLIRQSCFPVHCDKPELIETHISWVILCNQIVFKIKKPVRYSFLNFSTLEKRLFYCQQEVLLNRRLVENIYLGVVPIVEQDGRIEISLKERGKVIDYAVMMTRMPTQQRMDNMLRNNEVTLDHMEQVAKKLVQFHESARIVFDSNYFNVQHNFNDLKDESDYIASQLGTPQGDLIKSAIKRSDDFMKSYHRIFKLRSELGHVRDCHGDLHSRNIFLLDEPVIFDCIEFNEDIRHIDILNELAFFCMDLEVFGHNELSEYFMVCYTKLTSTIHSQEESDLFVYFKAYRANVRAKVNALRAKSTTGEDHLKALSECDKYLKHMNMYLEKLPAVPK